MSLAVYGAIRTVSGLFADLLVAAGRARALFLIQILWLAVLIPTMYVGIKYGWNCRCRRR